MKMIRMILAALLIAAPTMGYSQSSSRDADIDAKLNAGSMMGIAPPTGSQAVTPSASGSSQKFADPYLAAMVRADKAIVGQTDGKGRVYDVKGKVTLTKKGSPVEKKLSKGDMVVAGDIIQTEAGSAE